MGSNCLRISRRSVLACAALGTPSVLLAQGQPSKVLRVVVPYAVGSATDAVARLVAAPMFGPLGYSPVVENQPAANGIPATAAFARLPAEPPSLLVIAANHVVNPSLYANVPYDPTKDFQGVIRIGHVPFILCGHPSVPADDVASLVKLLKERAGQLSYASPGNGSPPHLAMELFKQTTGTSIVHVPYRGAGQALADLLGGQVQLAFVVESAAIPQLKAGKLKPFGISSAKRSANVPDIPALAESGVAGFDLVSWIGMVTQASVPPKVVADLGQAALQSLQSPGMAGQLARMGVTVAPLGAQDFNAFMASESGKWTRLVKQSGTKLD